MVSVTGLVVATSMGLLATRLLQCDVLPASWMTSCVYIMELMSQNQRRRVFRPLYGRVRHLAVLGRSLLSATVYCFKHCPDIQTHMQYAVDH